MTSATLHLVADPLCGWCYGASSLFEAALEVEGLDVEIHFGGMLMDGNRKQISPDWKGFVSPHDQRIQQVSGQVFGENYKNVLLNDYTAILDSEPPIKAILAAKSLGLHPVTMLGAIQKAMFFDGKRVADFVVLKSIAVENGLDGAAFEAAYKSISSKDIQSHIHEAHKKMQAMSGNGFPSAGLKKGEGYMTSLAIGSFYGNVDAWLDHLKSSML
jgi:putative protein-disulfide isomerase